MASLGILGGYLEEQRNKNCRKSSGITTKLGKGEGYFFLFEGERREGRKKEREERKGGKGRKKKKRHEEGGRPSLQGVLTTKEERSCRESRVRVPGGAGRLPNWGVQGVSRLSGLLGFLELLRF